jgi:type II secretory pathway pseudopilin PulG
MLRRDNSPLVRLARRWRARLACERGFTIVETLVVAALLIVVLTAVASISESTRGNANADQKRTDTLDRANAGLGRMVADLRQACYLIPPASAAVTGTFCRTTSTTLAASTSTGTRTVTPNGTAASAESTACAPTATPATTDNNCIQFLMRGRTGITRDPGTGAVTTVTRPLWRVRYNCAVRDPRDPRATTTQCERFATQCTTSAGATTCLAPCSGSATGCAASAASTDDLITGSVTNAAVTNATNIPRPIFLYCARTSAETCSATFSGLAAAIRVELAIARRGTLRNGLGNSIDLKDTAELRNNVSDSSTRDDGPGA